MGCRAIEWETTAARHKCLAAVVKVHSPFSRHLPARPEILGAFSVIEICLCGENSIRPVSSSTGDAVELAFARQR